MVRVCAMRMVSCSMTGVSKRSESPNAARLNS